jgi:hypothetical protein
VVSGSSASLSDIQTRPRSSDKDTVMTLTSTTSAVTPGAVDPGYTTTEFWQTLLVNVVAAVVAIGTIFRTNFNLNGAQAAVPAAAVLAAAIAQAFYSHSRATVKVAAQAASSSVVVAASAPPKSVPAAQVPAGGLLLTVPADSPAWSVGVSPSGSSQTAHNGGPVQVPSVTTAPQATVGGIGVSVIR